jgi:acetyl-CoA carboxylase biotin carboxylase subunit
MGNAQSGPTQLIMKEPEPLSLLLIRTGIFILWNNKRVQVEHPVNRTSNDVDLIREQIMVAAGERLKVKVKRILAIL